MACDFNWLFPLYWLAFPSISLLSSQALLSRLFLHERPWLQRFSLIFSSLNKCRDQNTSIKSIDFLLPLSAWIRYLFCFTIDKNCLCKAEIQTAGTDIMETVLPKLNVDVESLTWKLALFILTFIYTDILALIKGRQIYYSVDDPRI